LKIGLIWLREMHKRLLVELCSSRFSLETRSRTVTVVISCFVFFTGFFWEGTQGMGSVATQLGLTSSQTGLSTGGNDNNAPLSRSITSSSEGVSISRPPDEAVLPKSAQTDELIENLMDSGKTFIVHPEDTDLDSFDHYKIGPASTGLTKMSGATVAIGQKSLQVNHSSNNYSMQGARADCSVTAGKWYFEVKLESNGQAQIGWCTDDYDGTNNKVLFE
jgi:hypothetical protein